MTNNRARPEGFMTVGEVAKKMGITVRTLQYYDKEGLFSPSLQSEGGRRLYTDKDLIKLHQILSMKHLGFSLDDIKNRLVSLDTPEQVANALEEQADALRKKIESLSEALRQTEALREEVLKMQSVDFKKYADIIVNLQMKNDFYWLIKHFDDKTLDHIRSRFDKDSGLAMINKFNCLQEEAISLYEANVSAQSERGLRFAEKFWNMIVEFTGGDMSMIPTLMKIGNFEGADDEWRERQVLASAFIEPALDAYFKTFNVAPIEGEMHEE